MASIAIVHLLAACVRRLRHALLLVHPEDRVALRGRDAVQRVVRLHIIVFVCIVRRLHSAALVLLPPLHPFDDRASPVREQRIRGSIGEYGGESALLVSVVQSHAEPFQHLPHRHAEQTQRRTCGIRRTEVVDHSAALDRRVGTRALQDWSEFLREARTFSTIVFASDRRRINGVNEFASLSATT